MVTPFENYICTMNSIVLRGAKNVIDLVKHFGFICLSLDRSNHTLHGSGPQRLLCFSYTFSSAP